jgi:anti-sigma-K factor RskA
LSDRPELNHRELEELLAAFALGILEQEELRSVQGHLRVCPSCRASLERYEEVTGMLGLSALEAEPPEGLQERILEGLGQRPRRPRKRVPRFWTVPRLAPAWAAAGALVLAILIGFNALLWRQVRRLEARTERLRSQLVALEATESAPQARGLMIIDAGQQTATLVVEGLPALDPDRRYQLWLIRDGQRTSGGLFSVSPGGVGVLVVTAPQPLGNYQAFGVTVEPAGGSPGPIGPRVLGGRI